MRRDVRPRTRILPDGYVHWIVLQIAERIRADVTTAMKAGEKDRVAALRLVLSELQKAEKAGDGDELAVLRRERKRRVEAAEAFRAGDRPELAAAEDAEAAIIAAYLPAELDDDELREVVARAVEESGASSPKDMGMVMKAAMPRVGGRADGKRVQAMAKEQLST